MTDARLRDLERRFRDTDDPADEAAWLAERLRARQVDTAGVRLAAHLGHAASIQVAERRPPEGDEALLTGLLQWKKAIPRLGAAVCWAFRDDWERQPRPAPPGPTRSAPPYPAFPKVPGASERMCADLDEHIVTGAQAPVQRLHRLVVETFPLGQNLLSHMQQTPADQIYLAALGRVVGDPRLLGEKPHWDLGYSDGLMVHRFLEHGAAARVLAAARAELIPWALKTGDPVADRVAARKA